MILRSERAMKIRKPWNNYLVNDIRWMRSGCRGVLNYKYVHNKTEREFHTGEAEYSRSCECLGSCLVTECSKMKSSMLLHVFEYGPLPRSVHVVSTWHHSHDKYSQAFPVFATLLLPCIILNANWTTKMGRPGNEGTGYIRQIISNIFALLSSVSSVG